MSERMIGNPRQRWQICSIGLIAIVAALLGNMICAGHSPMVEAPLKTSKLIDDFIK
jgi:hypothetical protein